MTGRIFETDALRGRGRLRRAGADWLRNCKRPPAAVMPSWLQLSMQTTSNPPGAQRYVAVYGTLRRGGSNDIEKLAPAPHFVGSASLRGKLHHMGPYPGLVLASAEQGGSKVVAEVYEVSPALEAVLDEIEAAPPSSPDEYAKRELLLAVQTDSGMRELHCFLYEVNPQRVVGCPVIPHGDWMREIA